jgi:hypothetical protein
MNLPGKVMDHFTGQDTPSFGDRTIGNPMARTDTLPAVAGSLTDPLAYAVGGAAMKGANYIPEIGKIAPWMNNYLRGILGGTAAGATVGGITNGTEGAESGAVGGAVVSAALPVALRTVVAGSDVVRNILGSITKSGRISTGQKLAIDQLAPNERMAVYEILNPNAPSKTVLGNTTVDVNTAHTTSGGTPLTVPQIIAQRNVGQQTKSTTGARLAALEDEVARRQGGESIVANRAAQQGEV